MVAASLRAVVLRSAGAAPLVIGSLLGLRGGPGRPRDLGVQDYGGGQKSLGLCPPAPSCVSTAEDPADREHYAPPWNYNPLLGRGGVPGGAASREQAMRELEAAVAECREDGYSPRIVERRADYLGAEFKSRWLGAVDDVEFWFPPGTGSRVEYRSAARAGGDDQGAGRRRVRALRRALEKSGWRSERL